MAIETSIGFLKTIARSSTKAVRAATAEILRHRASEKKAKGRPRVSRLIRGASRVIDPKSQLMES